MQSKTDYKISSDRWKKTYLHWLDGIQDWCISRQLWWAIVFLSGIKEWNVKLDFQNPDHVHVSVEGPTDPENWSKKRM